MSSLVFQEGITDFTFDLYGAIEKSGNEILSPFSISTAMLFLMLGTGGTTKRQMFTSMFKSRKINNVHSSYQALSSRLTELTGNGVTLSSANRLFGRKDLSVLKTFTSNAQLYYNSNLETMDFAGKTEESRQRINSWIETNTNNKIQNMISPGAISSSTVMVLANAIYFKGDWEKPFFPNRTRKMNFYVSQNVQKPVDMMYRRDSVKAGANLDIGCKILELPFIGKKLSMLFLLPTDADGLSRLESRLTPKTLKQLLSSLIKQETIMNIPKFKITADYNLNQILMALGMTEIFDTSANFSNMVSPPTKIFVSKVLHKAFIEVNEKGSEAAAATVVEMVMTSSVQSQPPFEFLADHPFLFMIRDNASGIILFIGRYAEP